MATGAGDTVVIVAARLWRVATSWPVVLAAIVAVALGFRLHGLDWDRGHHLHPDERFLSLVEAQTTWPSSLGAYFDTTESPLNPNRDASYSYGTFPLFLTKAVAAALGRGGYDDAYLVGRALTALFDVGTVVLVFAIGSLLWSRRVGLLAGLLSALTVLQIQLAHFWTVDPYLTFFSTAALYFAVRIVKGGRLFDYLLCGVAIGLGLACKVTALPLVAVPVAAAALQLHRGSAAAPRRILRLAGGTVGAAVTALLAFRIAQPYAFAGPHVWDLGLDSKFLAVIREQRELTSGTLGSPPFVQWAGRTDFLYPLQNMVLWGMGVPLAAAAFAGCGYAAYRLFRFGDVRAMLPLLLAATVVGLYGGRFATFARYFEPAYPALVLLAAAALAAAQAWGRRQRHAALVRRTAGRALVAAPYAVVACSAGWALAFTHVYREPHTRVEASQWIYEHVPTGARLTAESWDDPLPLTLAGSRRTYESIPLELYGTDSRHKIERLLERVDRADYIVLSSDRVRKSIPRIPAQHPATIRYYEALEDGSLGFDLAAKFERFPKVLGLELRDDWAEESLTVYDHPVVRIYRRTPRYDAARARAVLLAANPDRAVDLTPRQGDFNGLLLTPRQSEVQAAGGTWKELFGAKIAVGRFSPSNLARDHPALVWLLALELLSLLAMPIVLLVLRALPDAGYPLAKPLGLLFVAYPVWLGVSVGGFTFSGGSVFATAAVVAALAGAVAVRCRTEILAFIRRNWPYVVLTEALFVGTFLAFYALRTANPDLWHPFRGGEKPMDFAYLNAVVKSTTLPPYDPWFGGGYLNYYYFGQFMTAALIKPLGIAPEVAYNLAVPMFAAFTAAAVFSLGANLVAAARAGSRSRGVLPRAAAATGLVATALVLVVGNLDAGRQWVERFQRADTWQLVSGTWFPGRFLATLGGLWSWIVRQAPLEPFDWWRSSRVIPDSLAITEFPFWSFLFADLHAHLMAIPLAVAAASTSLALVLAGAARHSLRSRVALLVLTGGLIGALRATNAWDVPTQLVVGTAATVACVCLVHRRFGWVWLRAVSGHVALLAAAAWFLFLPFGAASQPFAGGLDRTPGTTPLTSYLVHFGILLFVVAGFVGGRAAATLPRSRVLLVAGALLVAVVAAVADATRYDTAAVLLALAALLLWMSVREVRRGSPPGYLAVYAAIVLAVVVTAAVETARIQNDIERQNTVFKFYVQAWWLLAVGAAFAAWFVADAIHRRVAERRLRAGTAAVTAAWATAAVILLAAGLLYPLSAVGPRVADRFGATPPTPDGMAYMIRARYGDARGNYELRRDYDAILWAREHIVGSPIILEGVTPSYRWGNRFSVYTGLPAVIGWDFHQTQQRLAYQDQVVARREGVASFYNTRDARLALEILARYDVRYVFVGQLERAYHARRGIEKIRFLPGLTAVYDHDGVQIYRVDQAAVARELL